MDIVSSKRKSDKFSAKEMFSTNETECEELQKESWGIENSWELQIMHITNENQLLKRKCELSKAKADKLKDN